MLTRVAGTSRLKLPGRGLERVWISMTDELKKNAKVLLSELPEDLTEALSKILQGEGYQVTALPTSDHFKQLLSDTFFNLIILYRSTSGENGEDLLRYVKGRYPSTLVIIVSDNGCLEEAIECIRQGAYDYLSWPIEPGKLVSVVERSLGRQMEGFRHKEITRSLEEKVIHLQQLNQRMAALYKIIRDTRGLPTLEDSLRKVMEHLGEAIDLQSCFCLLFDERCEKVVLQLDRGQPSELGDLLLKSLLRPPPNLKVAFTKGRNINEVSQAVERQLLEDGLSSEAFENLIVCPLIILKNLYGYLCLVNPGRSPYTFADRQMLSIVASQAVAICEENHSLMQTSQLITMGNLTSELAHDLKTPLSNVKGILQTLEGKWDKESLREEAVQMMHEEINRADNLAVELLAFAKNQELEIGYWNIHQLLTKALRITRNTLAKAGISLEKHFSEDSLMVWANDNELIDSFVNLIVNAAQAMPHGGQLSIATRVSFHQKMTSQGSPARGRYVQVEFTDTGIGMTRWELDRIFERFYTTKPSGTGLGLSIVDRVVKKYQGFIDVKSVKEQGTSFFVNIPQR